MPYTRAMEPLFPTPGPEHVAEAVRCLVAAADPLQIVVFGSVARGEAGPESDLDLLVIMPDGTDRRAARRILSLSLAQLEVPKDVVVTTPAHAAQHEQSCWHIVATALEEGTLVYSRP